MGDYRGVGGPELACRDALSDDDGDAVDEMGPSGLDIRASHRSEPIDFGDDRQVRKLGQIVRSRKLRKIAAASARPSRASSRVEANVGFLRAHVFNMNADLEQPIGENTLTVTANYRRSVQRFLNDCDGTRIDDCHLGRDNISDDYFLDAHLASPGDARLRWLVGAVYQRFDISSINVLGARFPLSYLVPGAPSNIPVRFDTIVGGDIKSESIAVYGDLRWKLSDIWSVTGQVRYSQTEKNALQTSIAPLLGLNVVDFPASVKNDFVPVKVGLEGQVTPNILVYASFAKAFMDGAGNILPYNAKVSFNLGGDYEFEPVSGYSVSLGAEYAYHSRIYFSEFNDVADSQPGVGVFNASASLSPASASWRLFAYGNNLSNETIKSGVTIYSGIVGTERAVSYAPPRNFGLGVSVSF